jgi:DNA ligase (NAD+)
MQELDLFNQQNKPVSKSQPVYNSVIPENCPSCGQKLTLSSTGIDLFCLNSINCPDQIRLKLSYFTSRGITNIVGLSDKIIEKLIIEFGVNDPLDLFNLDYQKISELEGMGLKSAQNIQTSIDKARSGIPDYRFLAGLSIDGIGPEISKLICQILPS